MKNLLKLLILLLFISCSKQEMKPKTAMFIIKIDYDLDRYSNMEGYPKYPVIENKMYEISKAVDDTTEIWFTATKLDYTLKASYDDYRVKRKLIKSFKKLSQ